MNIFVIKCFNKKDLAHIENAAISMFLLGAAATEGSSGWMIRTTNPWVVSSTF